MRHFSVRRETVRREGWVLFDCRVIGAGTRTRTEDLLITNQLLYQLSYAGPAWTTYRS